MLYNTVSVVHDNLHCCVEYIINDDNCRGNLMKSKKDDDDVIFTMSVASHFIHL